MVGGVKTKIRSPNLCSAGPHPGGLSQAAPPDLLARRLARRLAPQWLDSLAEKLERCRVFYCCCFFSPNPVGKLFVFACGCQGQHS